MFGPQPLMFADTSRQVMYLLSKCKKLQYISDTIDQDSYQKHSLTQWSETDQEIKLCQEYPYQQFILDVREEDPFNIFSSSPKILFFMKSVITCKASFKSIFEYNDSKSKEHNLDSEGNSYLSKS